MDFWAQFWATMWGALAGAVVAGVLSWWVASSTLKKQATQRSQENLDAALASLFSAIVEHVAQVERWERSGMRDISLAPSNWRLQIDVDVAWMAAKTPTDTQVMTFIGKALYTVPKTDLEWRTKYLPEFVENVRAWRTGETQAGTLIEYLEDFSERADRNRRFER